MGEIRFDALDDKLLRFRLAVVSGKKVSAAADSFSKINKSFLSPLAAVAWDSLSPCADFYDPHFVRE